MSGPERTFLVIVLLACCASCNSKAGPTVQPTPATTADAQQSRVPDFTAPASRAEGLAALIATAEAADEDGDAMLAGRAFRLASYFEPENEELVQKGSNIPQLRPGEDGMERIQFMADRMREIMNNTSAAEDLAPWEAATGDDVETREVGLLLDEQLVGDLDFKVSELTVEGQEPFKLGMFFFTPELDMDQVLARHGEPTAKTEHDTGAVTYTYGRFRVVGTSEGQAAHVLFLPFEETGD